MKPETSKSPLAQAVEDDLFGSLLKKPTRLGESQAAEASIIATDYSKAEERVIASMVTQAPPQNDPMDVAQQLAATQQQKKRVQFDQFLVKDGSVFNRLEEEAKRQAYFEQRSKFERQQTINARMQAANYFGAEAARRAQTKTRSRMCVCNDPGCYEGPFTGRYRDE